MNILVMITNNLRKLSHITSIAFAPFIRRELRGMQAWIFISTSILIVLANKGSSKYLLLKIKTNESAVGRQFKQFKPQVFGLPPGQVGPSGGDGPPESSGNVTFKIH